MANADQIADRALEMARAFLDQSTGELVEMSDGDHDTLFHASQIVRERSTGGPSSEHSIEHLAFSLIASAHDQLRNTKQ